MPTYEYRCADCRHEFEKFQRMSEEPQAECPVCGGQSTRKLSGGAGLLFKGSGFYITDYRSDSYKKAAGSDNGGAESSKGSGGTGEGGSAKDTGAPASSSETGSKSAKAE